jgi:murein DD-endopeptidase MepM/ murein hydrolase activator NlpD
VSQAVDKAVVKEIAERFPSSILEMGRGGRTVDIFALRSNANANIRQAAFNIENGLMKHVQNWLLEKQAQNPAMTGPQKQAVIQGAIEEYTNSKYFEKLFPGAHGNPNADGTPSPSAQRPQQRSVYQGPTYSSSQLRNLPDSDLRGFNQRPLLSPQSVRSEVESAANGRGFSAELRSAAKRAGTTPLRMLEEQLKFNPSIPVPPEMLNDIRRRERAATGTRAAAQQTAYNPLTGAMQGSANWLMNLLVPPAAAATLPPSFSYRAPSQGRLWQSSDRRGQALIAMAQRNGWDPADLAAIISFETGGTLNPLEPGRGAAAGRIGLIQAGPNERAAYGLGSGDWNRELLGIERYLKGRGAKPGMGLADLYATVNGGNPGAGWQPDGNGVTARSASTMRALERHRQQALNRLGMVRAAGGGLGAYRSQVSSITFDNGQPGLDVFFEDKRVPAVLSGRVKDIGFQGGKGIGYGHYMVVESTDPATGRKVDVLYAHLPERPRWGVGTAVRAGQIIGRQGGTGRVRSADGTIASIDFLEPRPPGSRDMTPYRHYDRLRRRIAQQLGG